MAHQKSWVISESCFDDNRKYVTCKMCLTFIKVALNKTNGLAWMLIAPIWWLLFILNPICWSNRFVVTHTHHLQPLFILFVRIILNLKPNFNDSTSRACVVGATGNMLGRIRANDLWNVDNFCVDFELLASNACSRNWFFTSECWTKSFGAVQFNGFASRKFNFTVARFGIQKLIGSWIEQQWLWFA